MTGWRPALVAMLAWAFHFFAAYGVMLVAPDSMISRVATIGLATLCLIVVALAFRRAPGESVVQVSSLTAAIGIVFQGLVAVF